jgi:hypothetical protein
MKTTVVLGAILLLLPVLVPVDAAAQPFGGTTFANPLGGVPPALVNGGFHFHINPSEDHFAFESLERDSYQYYALHGYDHYTGKDLQQVGRFKDIQYPSYQPRYRSSLDSFFGVESYNPLKW